MEGSTLAREFDAPPASDLIDWTPDGRAITFVRMVGNTRNLFMQMLDGSEPVQLTHFDSEPSYIEAYAWSRDGTKIAITRSLFDDHDIMMFSNLR